MDFLMMDPKMDEHPDVMEAGFAAASVFQGILRVIARWDGKGRLRAKFAHGRWLARSLNIETDDIGGQVPEVWVNQALNRCVRHGLLVQDGDDYVVPGWERFYRSPRQANAERQQRWRDRQHDDAKAAEESTKGDEEALRVTRVTTNNVTEQNSTQLNSTKKHVRAEPASPAPEELLQAVWNEMRTGELAEWQQTGKARRQLAQAAIKRRPIEGPGGWRDVMARLAASAFCRGTSGSWKADPDWWLRPEGRKPEPAQKLLEGAYDGAVGQVPFAAQRTRPDPNAGIVMREGGPCVDCGRHAEAREWEDVERCEGPLVWRCYGCMALMTARGATSVQEEAR